MLYLISEEDYQRGLNKIGNEMIKGPIKRKTAGSTQVWLIKD